MFLFLNILYAYARAALFYKFDNFDKNDKKSEAGSISILSGLLLTGYNAGIIKTLH